MRLAEQLFATPIVTALRVRDILEVTRPTAQAAIDALVEDTHRPRLIRRTNRSAA